MQRQKNKKYARSNKRKIYNKNVHKNKQKNGKITNVGFDRKRNNFKFIKRSKEAEDFQRRQKIIEEKYKQDTAIKTVDDDSSEEDKHSNEEEALESLLSTFKQRTATNNVADSSSDENEDLDIEDTDVNEDESEEKTDDEEETDVGKEFKSKAKLRATYNDKPLNCNSEIEEEGEEKTEFILEEELNEEIEKLERNNKLQTVKDPFSIHLDYELSSQHVQNLTSKPTDRKTFYLKWPKLGKLSVEIPKARKDNVTKDQQSQVKKKTLLSDHKIYASEGVPPTILNSTLDRLSQVAIKEPLLTNIGILRNTNSANTTGNQLSGFQTELFSIMNNYQDLYYSQRNFDNAEDIRLLYCLHGLNHMLKTRAKIMHHNAKLSEASKKKLFIVPDSYQDQGLVRPKILILLPFRDSAYKVVNNLIKLLYGDKSEIYKTNGTVVNYKRFEEQYTGLTLRFPKTNPKPVDYEQTFAGNTDDNFRIGISLTKKCLKLYTEFYSSDILIASPLGLRMIIGAPGDTERDYDFLSSIELLILDQAEIFMAQNWDHILHILDHMHLQTQSGRNTDISRLRSWCSMGYSHFYRQTLLFTSHDLAEFRSLFNNKCNNFAGKIRTANSILVGSIRNVVVSIPQVYHSVYVTSLSSSFDERFKFFVKEILPQFKSPLMSHCMVYIPSYFDFVRLRNYFKAETINFVQICEYTNEKKIARARDMFYHGGAHFLLYSERGHFFRRTRIKGVRHLIMYQPPYWPNLYHEMINLMQNANQNPRDDLESSMSITVLHTKYDVIQISSIIGTDRASKLMQSTKPTHVFVAGDVQ